MRQQATKAKLFYVIGPSGSGKDSLLQYCRQHNFDARTLQFAHRYITREASAGGENHIHLSQAEFDARQAAGLFALSWQSHGLSYGIGIEIDHWMRSGVSVVVNGSRAYYQTARELYANIVPITVTVSPEVLAQRLTARGRETAQEVKARLERNQHMSLSIPSIIIENDTALADAGDAMLGAMQQRLNLPCASNF